MNNDPIQTLRDFAPIPVRALIDKELGCAALRVLGIITAHVNKGATCYPSQSRIADMLGISRPTVNGYIKTLEDRGYIKKKRQTRGNGSETSCLYTVLYDLPPVENPDTPCRNIQQPLSSSCSTPPVDPKVDTHNKPMEQTKLNIEGFLLPEWIDPEEWKGFEELRRKKKKPLTDRARTMHVNKLKELQVQGYDPAAVIQQSIMRGWDSFYPIKDQESKTVNGTGGKEWTPF